MRGEVIRMMNNCAKITDQVGSCVFSCTRPKEHEGSCEHFNGAQLPLHLDHITLQVGMQAIAKEYNLDLRTRP